MKEKNILIDLSADFRLQNKHTYEEFYKIKHRSVKNIKNSIYALPEIIKKKIKTNAVARFSIMALAFSKNRPSDEKIDLTVLICDSINFYK